MTRHPTAYYTDQLNYQFWWADSDNDLFDRDFDLYRMSQALEHHDHAPTRGKPVQGVGANSILEGMYGIESIPEWALQDNSVTTRVIGAGQVTDEKLAIDKVNVAGDTMLGDLRVTRENVGYPQQGYVFLGKTGDRYVGTDGVSHIYYNTEPAGQHIFYSVNGINAINGGLRAAGDGRFYRLGIQNTGYVFFSTGNMFIGYDGSSLLYDNQAGNGQHLFRGTGGLVVNEGGVNAGGDIRTRRPAAPTTGYVFFGNTTSYIGLDGTSFIYYNDRPSAKHIFYGDGWFIRNAAPTTGFAYFGNSGSHAFGWNGAYWEADGEQIALMDDLTATAATVVNFPLGGIAAFQSFADVNSLGIVRWERWAPAEGRLLVGGGIDEGGANIPFTDGQYYGTPSGANATWIIPTPTITYTQPTPTYTQPTVTHTLATGQIGAHSASYRYFAPGGTGNTYVSTEPHVHPSNTVTGTITLNGGGVGLTGGGASASGGGGQWMPPMICVHWARRKA